MNKSTNRNNPRMKGRAKKGREPAGDHALEAQFRLPNGSIRRMAVQLIILGGRPDVASPKERWEIEPF